MLAGRKRIRRFSVIRSWARDTYIPAFPCATYYLNLRLRADGAGPDGWRNPRFVARFFSRAERRD